MVAIHTIEQHLFRSTPSTSHFLYALYRFCESLFLLMLVPLAAFFITSFCYSFVLWHGFCGYNCSPDSPVRFAFLSGLSGTSLFNSISLMAYNIFYTSLPVMTIIFDKDISETTVMENPQILLHSQGR